MLGQAAERKISQKRPVSQPIQAFFLYPLFMHLEEGMRVLKFGGSSLADPERFLRAADIIANNAQQEEVAVVLSAPGKNHQ
ncbi:hypothetical protein VC77_10280 [Vibrio cholerae]|nr:hypothetical protein VC77_10280 [Vibrio cholerae]